jgi:hypothetical protein
MSEPIVVDLPQGRSIEVSSEWKELASARWNRLEDDGYVQWTQTVCQHADGRILVYVIVLPSSGILRTAGELLPAGSQDVAAAVERLAEQYDVPTNVAHLCISHFEGTGGKRK